MSYYTLVGMKKEPFSTSPDPDFFYPSREHDRALTHLLIELHLRRGLSLILGDVGTGKTTLARKLVKSLKDRGAFTVNIMLDPSFASERMFLLALLSNFDEDLRRYAGRRPLKILKVFELKQVLQKYLFDKCIQQGRTVVVIIDEAQKMNRPMFEALRVMLNYETNDAKLMQLVLLGQTELKEKIDAMPNFWDRVSYRCILNPLGVQETKDMILFRLNQAGYKGESHLFEDGAVDCIHRATQGYPRKTTLLCHRALVSAVMNNRSEVGEDLVRTLIEEDTQAGWLTLTHR